MTHEADSAESLRHYVTESPSQERKCFVVKTMKKILIGNAFPLTLIRRKVRIEPVDINDFRKTLENAEIFSFWGHANTLPAASVFLGVDLTPQVERAILKLNRNHLPEFDGREFREVFIVSPNYIGDFRPRIGEEVPLEKIRDWQLLKIAFGVDLEKYVAN